MWPFLNNVITTCPDSYCTPASSICYTGPNLSCIGVNQNDTLSVALQKINALMCEPITLQKVVNAGNTIVLPSNVNRGIDITVPDLQNQYSNGIRVTVDAQTGAYSNNDAFVAIINGQNPGSLPNFVGGFYAVATGADNFSFVSEHINGTVSSSHYRAINVLGITSNFASFSTNNIEVYNVDYLGNTTANSFVKTGGTSDQFLKADGSVSTVPYKVYTALLTQTGTNAPTAIVLENTIGTTISYSYTSSGTYNFIATGNPFTLNKTAVFISGQLLGLGFGTVTTAFVTTSNQGIIGTQQSSGGVNDYLINTPIEIRVYN